MKKNILLAISLAFIVSGCGGGSSYSEVYTNTGKGYYVDSAVEGVQYKCGGLTGTTGSSGEFEFEVGQDCLFKINDLVLSEVNADRLTNGAKIIVNEKVAQFLQSIDVDGNASNGILINEKIKNALRKVNLLNSYRNVNEISPSVLQESINDLKNFIDSDDFQGGFVTIGDAIKHLHETLDKIIKEKLSDKIFFIKITDSNTTIETDLVKIDVNVEKMTIFKKDGSQQVDMISIANGKIYINGKEFMIYDTDKKYIKFIAEDGSEIYTLYYNKPN